MALQHRVPLAALATIIASGPLSAVPDGPGIYADFDVGEKARPELPGHLSFSILLDSTTGLGDTATADRLVANFIRLVEGEDPWVDSTTGLVEKKPFFDGLPFYRLFENHKIHFGSRTGTGLDDPGWVVQDEFRSNHPVNFALFMDNDGENTNGCRYFIGWNNPGHPLIDTSRYPRLGTVITDSDAFPGLAGRNNVLRISTGQVDANGFATHPVTTINSVTIRRVGTLAANFDEDGWDLPEVSAEEFRIVRDDNTFRLVWSDEPGTFAQYFGSDDLVNWVGFEGYDPPEATILGADITSHVTSGPAGFFRGAAIHYPEWPSHELVLENARIEFEYPTSDGLNNLLTLQFGAAGSLVFWDKYYDPPETPELDWTQEGFGTLNIEWNPTRPFVGELKILSTTTDPSSNEPGFPPYTLSPYTLTLHFDHHLDTQPGRDRFAGSFFDLGPPPELKSFKGDWNFIPLPP